MNGTAVGLSAAGLQGDGSRQRSLHRKPLVPPFGLSSHKEIGGDQEDAPRAGHLEEMYGVEVSPTLISEVTDGVMEEEGVAEPAVGRCTGLSIWMRYM